MKQNDTKNEHFTQQWSVLGLFARNSNFWISFLLQVCDTFLLLTHLFLINVPSMLKADLNNFRRLSSFFYLMLSNLIKQLQICKCTLDVYMTFYTPWKSVLSVSSTLDTRLYRSSCGYSVIWRKQNNKEFTQAVQHHNAIWTCIWQINVIVSENSILESFIEIIGNFCF